MTTQSLTVSPLAQSIYAFERALEAVSKIGKFTFSINLTRVCPDDCGEIDIVFSEASPRNITFVATAVTMVANNERLPERVRDLWLSQKERDDDRFNVVTYWVQA